jgi:hypothetical protein
MSETFTPPSPLQTAVLFLVFNRPDTTDQVFEAIRKAKPPRLYVSADGPRDDRADEAEKVARVREIATAVDWPCEVKTLFQEENLGCNYAVSGGITWFFEHEEQGIILEDDCLPSQSFFWFCEELLNRYKNDMRIMMISGTNLCGHSPGKDSYKYRTFAHVWGWATWRRAWHKYDSELSTYPAFKNEKIFSRISNNPLLINFWTSEWDENYYKKRDSWVNPFLFQILLNHSMSIIPETNLIKNIGFGADATHMKSKSDLVSRSRVEEIQFPITHPTHFIQDLRSESFIVSPVRLAYFWFRHLVKLASRVFLQRKP